MLNFCIERESTNLKLQTDMMFVVAEERKKDVKRGPLLMDQDLLRSAGVQQDDTANRARAGVAAALFGDTAESRVSQEYRMRDRPDPGQSIGRYRVEGLLGAGTMGAVYRAYDPELDRRVALKVLHAESKGDGVAQARMLREARSLARLSHPNVIHVYDVGTAGRQVFVAMELVAGLDLKRHLELLSPSWEEVVRIFLDAGRGLKAAHDAGLIHRDFKPENVLVGDDGRVRVLDFGLAHGIGSGPEPWDNTDAGISESSDRNLDITAAGALVGTPLYMAPEQYRHGAASVASDQFSYCVALFEALYGHRPFAGETVRVYVGNVIEGRSVRIDEDAPMRATGSLPIALEAVIRRGLDGAPQARFSGMGELLRSLSDIVEPSVDRASSLTSRALIASVAVVFCLGAGGFAWSQAVGGDGHQKKSATESIRSSSLEADILTTALELKGSEGSEGSEGSDGSHGTVVIEIAAGRENNSKSLDEQVDLLPTNEGIEARTKRRSIRGNCYLHEDTYALLARNRNRREILRIGDQCYRCRAETRRERTRRFSPRGCSGYSVCSLERC